METSDGLILVISDKPRGTPRYGIYVKSVEKGRNGVIKIGMRLKEPPKNVSNVQMMTYPISYIKVRAAEGNF